MTTLNDYSEDPAGFRIEPDDGGWRWVRISDQASREGFESREAACQDASNRSREPDLS